MYPLNMAKLNIPYNTFHIVHGILQIAALVRLVLLHQYLHAGCFHVDSVTFVIIFMLYIYMEYDSAVCC